MKEYFVRSGLGEPEELTQTLTLTLSLTLTLTLSLSLALTRTLISPGEPEERKPEWIDLYSIEGMSRWRSSVDSQQVRGLG